MVGKRLNRWEIATLIIIVVVFGFAIATAGGEIAATTKPMPCPERGLSVNAEVIKIVDGDTIDCRVTLDFRVRLLDCWAPESRTRDLAEKQRGLAAKGYMLDLADGKAVRVFIPGSGTLGEMLTLDRILGRVYVLDASGEPERSDLSWQMIAGGHATAEKERAK